MQKPLALSCVCARVCMVHVRARVHALVRARACVCVFINVCVVCAWFACVRAHARVCGACVCMVHVFVLDNCRASTSSQLGQPIAG